MADDDDKVVNIGSARADKSGDCRDWTPVDALRDVLKDIEEGRLNPDMIYIAFSEMIDGGKTRGHSYRVAGCSRLEMLGLLTEQLHDRAKQ